MQKLCLAFVSLLALTGLVSLLPQAQADSGSSSATMTLVVPVQTVVSCASPSVTAATGSNTMTVTCTLSGNPNSLASGTSNTFGPSSSTLSDGNGHNLTASLQSSVTSPDGSLTSISGTSAGFSGSIQSLPAKVQATYSVNTTSTTKSGTYTGVTTYTWSTI